VEAEAAPAKPERELAPFETNFTQSELEVIKKYRRVSEAAAKAGTHAGKIAGKAKFDEYVAGKQDPVDPIITRKN
jgi:hypothetical protein